MHTEHVYLWLDDSNVVQYVASCHVFSVCYIFLILEQERWVNVGLEVSHVTGLYPSCRQFSWAAMATTWWQVETTVWWRSGRLVTSNSSTSIQAVMQASEPWTYHTIKGQGKQLYAGDGILGPWGSCGTGGKAGSLLEGQWFNSLLQPVEKDKLYISNSSSTRVSLCVVVKSDELMCLWRGE